jgi:hypothetical protein
MTAIVGPGASRNANNDEMKAIPTAGTLSKPFVVK